MITIGLHARPMKVKRFVQHYTQDDDGVGQKARLYSTINILSSRPNPETWDQLIKEPLSSAWMALLLKAKSSQNILTSLDILSLWYLKDDNKLAKKDRCPSITTDFWFLVHLIFMFIFLIRKTPQCLDRMFQGSFNKFVVIAKIGETL